MNKILGILILVFLMMLQSALLLQAADSTQVRKNDERVLQLKLPPSEKIDDYKTKPEFQYRKQDKELSFLQILYRWLSKLFNFKRGSFGDNFFSKYIWYTFFGAVLLFVIYKIFKSEIRGLLRRKTVNKVQFEAFSEDIHNINFTSQIDEAVQKKDFRLAIRLYYLKSLKELADQDFIKFKPDKTGHDYIVELSGKPIQTHFITITDLFNWIWYGEMLINEDRYQYASEEFVAFNKSLQA